MKINIIGGSGFIGTRLCELLASVGIRDFKIIDKRPSERFPSHCVVADVRSLDALRGAIDEEALILNLAAEHQDNVRPVSLYSAVNVDGASNVCVVAREKRVCAIIFTSSVAVYGEADRGADEEAPIRPINEYGRTKAEAEAIFSQWQSESRDERSLLIIRPTVVFGEGNRGNVYNLLRQIHQGQFVMVGSGNNLKSMAYVGNVAAFLLHAIVKRVRGRQVVNYVDKPDFSTADLVAFARRMMGYKKGVGVRLPVTFALGAGFVLDGISAMTGKKFPISRIRIKKFCADSCYASRAVDLGFKAPFLLTEALERTIHHEFDAS